MRTQRVRAELAAFDLAEYVAEIRRCGRRALEPSLRAHAAVLRPFLARAVREGLSPELFKLVRFAQSVVDGEGTLTEMATKRYVSYANLRVLNWVLGTNRHQPTDAIVRRCWEAVWSKLGTWRAYEERTLAGSESWNQADVDVHAVERRIEQLATLLTRPDAAAVPSAGRDAPPREWSAYVSDPTRTLALEHLTVLPQTVQHEEVAFLHTIHISESCFWAMLLQVQQAIECLKRKRISAAARHLERAVPFSDVVEHALRAMQTMPPESFLGFGGLTGTSSGIQSRSFHLLQIFLLGVDGVRADALRDTPELSDLVFYADPRFVSLRRALDDLDPHGAAAGEVFELAHRLDASAYRWRARHKGIADHYLPESVIGSVAGRRYLERQFRHRLFHPSGTVVDEPPWTIVGDIGGPGRRRVRPIVSWEN
ncbi:MAG TPA: hypothetical protein VK549_14740 [Acidimicrobiia bacterium]|nr:hypothetical protein [Acidimicrobiia bacterium]